jgi:acyl-CoA thioester hydrolase
MLIRVYYEDTDSLGVVYHANYLKFIERARSELFFAIGQQPQSAAGYFVVRSMSMRFIKSAKLGDLLEIKTSLKELRAASLWLDQAIYLDRERIFNAQVELVMIKEGKLARIDRETAALLNTLFES